MKQLKLYPKVAFDLFYEQFKWAIWFFSFLIAAHIIGMFIVVRNDASVDPFFAFSSYSVAIFMLVCGIIAAYGFLGYYVQQGITRKDLYMGTVLSALALAAAVTLVPLAVNGIEHFISGFAALPIGTDGVGAFYPSSGWLSATVTFFINAFTYYLIGWLIGLGYYRFGWIIGFVFVGIAVAALSLNGYFLGDSGLSSIIPWVPYIPAEAGPALAITGSLILVAVLLISTRLMTKRITIKM
ncbi:hypothetical protein [Planococcus wigleyi]|uniref:ABC transporter permease n=1 Tax=Planococcus wigleyi TaxID=2762216 RepID=A0ABR8WG59_9BACL|nr:hypothetical protein [Planococcus wigleyi]MBD8016051.1 hypothetical protein [Planococcus wigleyi]